MWLFAPADDLQKPSRLAITVWTLGLLSFVLVIAGWLLLRFYPQIGHNRFAEEAGAILLSDQGGNALVLAFLMGFIAVVLWVVFKSFQRKSGKAGKELAATGVVLGCMTLVGVFLYARSDSVFDRYPRPAELSAISSVRNIVWAQFKYSETTGQGSYAPSLKELQNEGSFKYIDGSGTTGSYRFLITAGPTDDQGKITTFRVVASPVEYGVTGWANFYSDDSGVLRYTVEDRPAWVKDSPLDTPRLP